MAEIPPWVAVGPTDYLRATQAGVQGGLERAALLQRGEEAADRMSLERQSMAQQQQAQQARMVLAQQQQAQQQRLTEMEVKARMDIAKQNALRMQTQNDMLNAYRQAQTGLGQARLQEAQAIARQKAEQTALAFRDEQGFAQEVSRGTPVSEALFKYPRTRPSIVGALTRTGDQMDKAQLASEDRRLGYLYRDRDHIDTMIQKYTSQGQDPPPVLIKRAEAIDKQIDKIQGDAGLQPPPPAGGAGGEQSMIQKKVARANELATQHPDWDKAKIIEQVNSEITQ